LLSSRPLTVAVLGLALMAAGCDRQSGDQAQPPAGEQTGTGTGELTGKLDRSHVGSPLPKVVVRDDQGQTLALASQKGPVLLNLWATWCAPCVTELPMLDSLAAKRAGKLQVLTVSQDMGEDPAIAEFLKDRKLNNLPAWHDPAGDLAFDFGGVLPTTVLYDADGEEVWRIIGGYDWTSPEADRLLAEIG
jgi:thiol-disulfide isomerase/thioredoxin